MTTGLEKIIGEIQAESDGTVKEILDKANAEAAQILQAAEKEADDACERLRREQSTRLADRKARAASAAALAKRQQLLAEKQRLIAEVLDKAKASIHALPEQEYFELIVKLVKKNALPQKGEIVFNEADRARLPKQFASALDIALKGTDASLEISEKTRLIDGGFVLVYEGIEENCSVASLFENNLDTLQDKIQALLFA